MAVRPRYPGVRVTANGNQLVSYHTETRIADGGVFYPITPSTEGGELYQQAFAEGKLNVFGQNTIAVEAEGEHAAQGGQPFVDSAAGGSIASSRQRASSRATRWSGTAPTNAA